LRAEVEGWAARYAPVHAVAHWMIASAKAPATTTTPTRKPPPRRKGCLASPERTSPPKFLEFYPAAVWEDQDECLSIQPEDIELEPK